MKKAKKRVPRLKTDKIVDAFLAQDLSKLDFSQFQPVRFEFDEEGQADQHASPGTLARRTQGKGEGARNSLYSPYTRSSGAGGEPPCRLIRPVVI
jgi:hypothetical protein